MPARYTARLEAKRGAVAQLYKGLTQLYFRSSVNVGSISGRLEYPVFRHRTGYLLL